MRTIVRLAALLLLCVPAALPAGEPAQPPRPNIVLIIADDLGGDDYGFLGHPHLQTPHLDKLAARSLTFTRGYVPSSLCAPSLASIITGLYPHQHGVTANDPPLVPGAAKDGRGTSPEQTARWNALLDK